MPKIEFPAKFGNRMFQVWRFEVGHSVLLLRSTLTKEQPTRIDIMFRAVGEMRLRKRLDELTVDLITGDDPRFQDVAIEQGKFLFAVSARDFPHGYVVAGSMFTAEDDLHYDDPSVLGNKELEGHLLRQGYFQP
ncbi:hypothetical protein ORV05_14055 [Amycolatopsis cynarae]|uniref:Uncharacterized protein n=1 Tax=Amycolatopsis cynarae TaxID=2995223 RepID=A0ABY7B8Z5_9PSEU|nr:hypothetical protein [Amycolatopsis sp. HUAS 11-8]WAL68835.1 hypothetical protein ORV05_14055 [Amycolatopsis sp. HUAS 11-8]